MADIWQIICTLLGKGQVPHVHHAHHRERVHMEEIAIRKLMQSKFLPMLIPCKPVFASETRKESTFVMISPHAV